MMSSLPFLILIFVIYWYVDKLCNLHGKCLMSYVFSLIIMYLSLSIIELFQRHIATSNKIFCNIIGYSLLLSIMMCFLWLNVMCFDIWSTFRKGRKIERRFTFYCAYAYGIPMILITTLVIVNKLELIDPYYNIRIGENGLCSISRTDDERSAHLTMVFIFTPIIICLLMNITLYTITAYKISCAHRDIARNFQKDGNSITGNRERDRWEHWEL
jgi:G protein-coupled receptor Mth (Methuselah protein)